MQAMAAQEFIRPMTLPYNAMTIPFPKGDGMQLNFGGYHLSVFNKCTSRGSKQQAAIPSNQINIVNVYKLSSNKKVACFLHAALLLLTKPTLLEAIQIDSLMTWPAVTTSAVNTFFPESNKMQRGDIGNIKQGVI
jgi:hypothetical protein